MFILKKKGFTLIELLVVIGIIGVLASIVLASLDGTKKKGRDARRISDLKQIQLALELYYDANASFPGTIYNSTLETAGYISKVPTDPSSTVACTDGTQVSCYSYTPYMVTGDTGGVNAACVSYHIGASLETPNHPELLRDADILAVPSGYSVCTRTGSPAADFAKTDAQACNNFHTWGVGCYDLRP